MRRYYSFIIRRSNSLEPPSLWWNTRWSSLRRMFEMLWRDMPVRFAMSLALNCSLISRHTSISSILSGGSHSCSLSQNAGSLSLRKERNWLHSSSVGFFTDDFDISWKEFTSGESIISFSTSIISLIVSWCSNSDKRVCSNLSLSFTPLLYHFICMTMI